MDGTSDWMNGMTQVTKLTRVEEQHEYRRQRWLPCMAHSSISVSSTKTLYDFSQ